MLLGIETDLISDKEETTGDPPGYSGGDGWGQESKWDALREPEGEVRQERKEILKMN